MDTAQVFAFYVFAFVAAATPGPSNAMILSTGSSVGTWKGLSCPLGASFGMAAMIVLSVMGVGELVAAAPAAVVATKVAGSLFLFWLAWKIARAGTYNGEVGGRAIGFVQAFLFQWMNPKGWLVSLSAGSTFLVAAQHSQVEGALLMGFLFAAAAFPAGFVWLGMGALVSRVFRGRRSARIFNVAMATALAASVALVWH